ncbi:MAG: UTP--glucose-1-phosphate uridylyltransferase GalU [Acutalibacteraceae bacterium]
MKITKAVIPAAGFGTRILPATKAMPKEMFPIVDKPSIQYIVEEAVKSGITDILIITSRGKSVIEDHFDKNPELETVLEEKGKYETLKDLQPISDMANIYFLRQKSIKGLGHAVGCAKTFVGNEPFAVLSGDDIIHSEKPVCKQLMDAFEKYNLPVVGAKEMPKEEIGKYGSLKVENLENNIFMCTDMVEKPSPDKILSLYSILGRYILTPEIFEILDKTSPGTGGEIQLTDALKVLSHDKGVIMVDFEGKRYDIGNKLGAMKASVEMALKHPEISKDFSEYLKSMCENI